MRLKITRKKNKNQRLSTLQKSENILDYVYLPTEQNLLLLMTRLNHHSYDVEFESQTRWYFEDINREVKQLTGNGRVERVVCE